jgi:uncharacterized protein (TIGR03435 family)
MEAYRQETDHFDLPQWARSRFAISVKIPPNTSIGICQQMLRNLLTERFHMITAVETREVSRYFLKVAKSGLKLKPVDGPPADPNASATMSMEDDGRQRYTFSRAPASRVFTALSAAIGVDSRARRIEISDIINETGLTGYYDGRLLFTLPTPSKLEQFPLPQSLDDAMVEQLGLTLELRKSPGRVLVIRSSDRTPTEN